MNFDHKRTLLAIEAARLYYYQGLTTEVIAREMGMSRPKVSRLLTFARESGLVEIRIHDIQQQPQELERRITEAFGVPQVKVVTVPANSGEDAWLQRVATFAANHLNSLIHSEIVIGLAWGATLDAISRQLTPKQCAYVDIVQLNGSGNFYAIDNFYIAEIYSRFARNYGARAHLFPVPAFFDHPESKQALWRERSIRRLIELAQRAELLVYSIGSPEARVPSYVYAGGFLETNDFEELKREGVAGDIATVFFRADGSFQGIPFNARASGPDLALIKQVRHSLCVVSGLAKVAGLRAALKGGLMSELIVDEPTAQALLRGGA